MGERLKTAVELAMERLKKQDAAGAAPEKLTRGQKERISAIRQEYKAKQAEKEILYQAERLATQGDPESQARLADGHRRDREFLQAQCEARIREVKNGGKS
jgi:hypothetical protein